MKGEWDRRRLRRLLRLDRGANATHSALDEEIGVHIELRIEQLIARGMAPEVARAEAMRRFGGGGSPEGFEDAKRVLHHSAEVKEGRIRVHEQIEAVGKDVSYAWRAMRKSPGFALTAVITLALGIGANTAVFGVVNTTLLRPLPYAQPDRLVMIWNHWENWPQTWLSIPEAHDYGEQKDIFAAFSPYSGGAVNLTGNGEPERVGAGLIPAGFLSTVGVRPTIGRDFTAEEDQPSGANVALLDHGLWQRRFAADPAIVGKTIEVNGRATQVLGVLPADFRLPDEFVGDRSQIYLPLRLGPPNENQRGSHFLLAIARLKPGVALPAANVRLTAFIEGFKKDHPNNYGPPFGATAVPVTDQVFSGSRKVLYLLLGAVAFVLLICCANVANLLLSRAEGRQREIAIRAALGAGRQRLARQLITESVILGMIGGVVALPLAMFGGPMLVGMGAANLPRADVFTFDVNMLLFTLAVSVSASLLFGVAPVMHALRGDLHTSLRASRGTSSAGGLKLRQLIVTIQVALAVVSVAGATVMLRSFQTLMAVAPGFKPDHVLTMRVSLPTARYPGISPVQRFYADLVDRVKKLPGVAGAGAINALPLTGQLGDWGLMIRDYPPPLPGQHGPAFDWQVATPGYFEAMHVNVISGRTFTVADVHASQPVVIISAETAREYWPNKNPLGAYIQLGGNADSAWRQVIGVVADVRHQALDKDLRPEMYLPHAQFPGTVDDSFPAASNAMTLVIRTSGDPARMTSAVRGIIKTIDPQLPLSQIRTLDDVLSRSVSTPRLATFLLGIFGVLALVLSAIGVYGVMAYGVARRTNEIGIRMALGAKASDVSRLVVRQGMRPAFLGLLLGVAAALAGAKLMRGLLYGVSETDTASLVAAVVVLGLVALAATVLPARKVSRVDPVSALRSD